MATIMKKVARLRMAQQDVSSTAPEPVRTTGRIKKPKAVFDPSDNYLPRAARLSSISAAAASTSNAAASSSLAVAAAGGRGSPEERRADTPETVTSTQPLPRQQEQQRLSSRSSGSGGSIGNTPSITSTVAFPGMGASPRCIVCFKGDNKRNKNKLVNCLDCGKKAHKLCLSADFECFDTLRVNYKCDDCRSCCICEAFSDIESKYDEELVTCTKCVKSYHFTCHIPNVHAFQQTQSDWKCNKCSVTPYPGMTRSGSMDAKAIREIMGVGEPPLKVPKTQTSQPESVSIAAAAAEAKTVAAAAAAPEHKQNGAGAGAALSNGAVSKATHQSSSAPKKSTPATLPPAMPSAAMRYSPNEPVDVPDVKYWSVAQVADYFAKDFPNEAHVFRDQEIDGMSLLLLKRSDVIKKLPIKLGPSLRIYSLILKLQTQLNDPTLGWNCGL